MILADKIIENRKKNGWSQEELAARLNVSRQSVSKWESAQATPDMKKLLQLSEVFGVSTDYLLRDDMETDLPADSAPVDSFSEDTVYSVSMEEANAFLTFNRSAASMVSTGVMMSILSPVLLILLSGLVNAGKAPISEGVATFTGTTVLLILIAFAVALFLSAGLRGKRFDYLENSAIDTQYGVSGFVKELRSDYAEKHSRRLIIGIMLCIISSIPLVMTQLISATDGDHFISVIGICGLLVFVAAGVKLIVLTCMTEGGFEKLLEEGDYTRLNKKIDKYDGIYWAIVTACYLGWSFFTMKWEMTWIVWPVAGVLFAAYREIIKAVIKAKN